MSDIERNAERARAYLDDPLIQDFSRQMKDALFSAFENANERDGEYLKNLCLAAKERKKFLGYLQSFLETEQIHDYNKKLGPVDSIAAYLARKK